VTPLRISIDTGGTFTDAVLQAADGSLTFAKVLSSSSIRARVVRVDASLSLTVAVPAWKSIGADFVRVWRVRGPGLRGVIAAARAVADGQWQLELDAQQHEWSRAPYTETRAEPEHGHSRSDGEALRPGSLIDLCAPWPAPILAARLLTCCASNTPLPPIAMRLGTTRGTNAMLEGRFDPVLLVVNEGLGDALEIGDQRRDRLFDPAPRRRPPIHRAVLEVTLRQDASGSVISPLDESAFRAGVDRAREQHGVTHAAVLLMHAWRNPQPEQDIAAILREAGFARVVASHECTGAEGYLLRGDATVADAALSSAVGDFLEAVERELSPGSTLEVATSAAALRPASDLPPRESLLSGPAGGAAAVLAIARKRARTDGRADDSAALGFDMGGTSTDALRVTDYLPRREQTPIAGRTLAVPSVVIESVAAGGGSICTAEHGVLRVGPESAASDPGPACYGRGGPLTVTDVDLLLGRADPARFAVPLDLDRSRAALDRLLASQREGGMERDATATLEALRAIADEAMASAIRAISARGGFDPALHTLISFGGAGGQHACAVAERLGVERIVHPAAAGLLSAMGMSRLGRERIRSEGVHEPLGVAVLRAAIERARVALATEHPPIAGAALEIERTEVAIGWRGQSAVIEIPFRPESGDSVAAQDAQLVTDARDRYRAVFGSEPPVAHAEISFVRVIAEWRVPDGASEAVTSANETEPGKPVAAHALTRATAPGAADVAHGELARWERQGSHARMWSGGRWQQAPLVDRALLRAGDHVDGPAIVADPHATLVIDINWTGVVDADGAITLTRTTAARDLPRGQRRADDSHRDPRVRSEVPEVRASALASIAVEMGEQLRRTAVSVNVRDRLDYSCGILDGEGRLATTAPHVPVHLGALGACVQALIAAHPMRGGDVIVTNDPAFGGSHLPDVTVVMAVGVTAVPAGDRDRRESHGTPPVAFIAARAHHAEIGGTRPGSMPPSARELHEEGVVIPPSSIGTADTIDLSPIERLLRSAPFPSRAVEDNLADLSAAVAALRRGAELLHAFIAHDGASALRATLDDLRRRSRERVIDAIQRLPLELDRAIEQRLDDGWLIRVRVARAHDRLRVDFSGSSGIHPGNLNAPIAVVRSAVMYAMRVLVESHERQDERVLPLNDGLLEPIDLIVPHGFLNQGGHSNDGSSAPHSATRGSHATSNAAVAAGNTETSQRVVDALLLALGVAACSQGTMNNLVMGGLDWSFYETIAGGIGATPHAVGASGLHAHMTNTRITDPETLERRMPLRLRHFGFRRGSGGGSHINDPDCAAMSAGGDGLVRELEFLAPAQVSFIAQRRASGPEGLDGGAAGEPGTQSLIRAAGESVTQSLIRATPLSGIPSLNRADGRVEPLPGLFELDALPGDRLRIETPGGGAWKGPRA